MRLPRTRNMFGTSLFRPLWGLRRLCTLPTACAVGCVLSPLRGSPVSRQFGCAPSVRLIAAQQTRGIRTARSGPSLGKRRSASFGMTIPKSDVVHSSRRQASSLYLVRLIRTRRARPVFEHEGRRRRQGSAPNALICILATYARMIARCARVLRSHKKRALRMTTGFGDHDTVFGGAGS